MIKLGTETNPHILRDGHIKWKMENAINFSFNTLANSAPGSCNVGIHTYLSQICTRLLGAYLLHALSVSYSTQLCMKATLHKYSAAAGDAAQHMCAGSAG